MKRFSYILFGILGLVLSAVSCSGPEEENPVINKPTKFVLNTPAFQKQYIDLQNTSTMNLTCSQPDYGFAAAASYFVQVSFTEDFADFIRGKCKCHYLELINSKLLFNVENRTGIVKIKNHIGVFRVVFRCVTVHVHEIIDSSFNGFVPVCALNIGGNYFSFFLNGFLSGFRLFLTVTGGKRKNHRKCNKRRKNFFHRATPCILILALNEIQKHRYIKSANF